MTNGFRAISRLGFVVLLSLDFGEQRGEERLNLHLPSPSNLRAIHGGASAPGEGRSRRHTERPVSDSTSSRPISR
jgi:hypothetical protein